MTYHFGDLPDEGRELLIKHLRIDFSRASFMAPRWFSAWARDEHSQIVGIFAVEFKYRFDGYVTILVLDKKCMTQNVLKAIYKTLFTQAVRLTAEVEPSNAKALMQVQRMGFVYEGYRRMGLEGTRDVLCYGMLKDDCVYLPGYKGPTVIAEPVIRDYEYVSERLH